MTRVIANTAKGHWNRLKPRVCPSELLPRSRRATLFQKIVEQAHHNGEPGVLFLDAANRSNPVPHLYPLEVDKPVRRAMAWPIRELLPGLGQPERTLWLQTARSIGKACASRW